MCPSTLLEIYFTTLRFGERTCVCLQGKGASGAVIWPDGFRIAFSVGPVPDFQPL